MSLYEHKVVAPKGKSDVTPILPAPPSEEAKIQDIPHCPYFLRGWCKYYQRCPMKHDFGFREQKRDARRLNVARLQQHGSHFQEVGEAKAAQGRGTKPAEAAEKQRSSTATIAQSFSTEVIKKSITDLVQSSSPKSAQKVMNKSNYTYTKKNIRIPPPLMIKPLDGAIQDATTTPPVQDPMHTQASEQIQVRPLAQAPGLKPKASPKSDTQQPRPKALTDSTRRLGNKLATAPKQQKSPSKMPKTMRNQRGISGKTELSPITNKSDCRDFKKPGGCPRKDCRWFHPETDIKHVPITNQYPEEVDTLIDVDKEPSTADAQTISNNEPTKSMKISTPKKKKKKGKRAVDIAYQPVVKEIQWKNNLQLSDRSFAINSLWAIFGTDSPSIKQIETWCSEMGSQGNFKYFSRAALENWFEVLQLNDTQKVMLILLPYVPEKINPSCRGYVMRIKNQYESEQAKPKYNTFFKFAELPNEICIKIWQFTHRFGRTVKVHFNHTFNPHDHERNPLFKRLTPPNPLWQTTKQSRQSAMLDKRCCYRFSDYFSYDFDTLFLADSAARFNQYKGWIDPSDCKTLRRLQFHYYDVRDCTDLNTWADDVAIFRNLRTLDIVLSDAKEEQRHLVKAKQMLPLVEKAIKNAYKYYGNTPPGVKVLALEPEKAKELGIVWSFW
ncbi:hypothetical protein ACMFMG_005926 [Clarireedia jacksonii]